VVVFGPTLQKVQDGPKPPSQGRSSKEMAEMRSIRRTRQYLFLLPGQKEPQEFSFLSGLTGRGLKVAVAEQVDSLRELNSEGKRPSPDSLRLFVEDRELGESEIVHYTVPPDQVIRVEVKTNG